jgi:hypothetical protein
VSEGEGETDLALGRAADEDPPMTKDDPYEVQAELGELSVARLSARPD